MADLDHAELAATYFLLGKMELVLIRAGVGSEIKTTNKLKILNFNYAM
jgi:hypothetical protein